MRTDDGTQLTSIQIKNAKNEKLKFKLGEVKPVTLNKMIFAHQVAIQCDAKKINGMIFSS
mgnify:CR=1 FL=1|jgi:hypothetical protein